MRINKWLMQRAAASDDDVSLTARLLQQRGYADATSRQQFLTASLGDLHDPFLLLGMAETTARIERAIAQGQKITIYGDYDVDGMTATSIMYRLIRHLGGLVDYYIPQRQTEGYGINGSAIEALAEVGSELIISVDCGITALAEAELARRLAVDLIITDHHSVPATLPDAYAIINPQQDNCQYPYKKLAGAGVALKIAQAFLAIESELFQSLVVLAAVGTIADIMPLQGENRIIARFGLGHFWQSNNLGLQALAKVGGLADQPLNAGHVGFVIGPRLNAVGRLNDAVKGVQLLLGEGDDQVAHLATELDQLNRQRRQTEAEILTAAGAAIAQNPLHIASGCVVVWGDNWHSGVVGIVASRLVEHYYRPCIVLSRDGAHLKGSARSIAGYSIYDALAAQAPLLEKFGGHQQAAGLTLKEDNLAAFIDGLKRYNDVYLTADVLTPHLKVDDYITATQIDHKTIDEIEKMQPFGVGNARPTFVVDGVMVEQARRIGKDGAHLKMVVNAQHKLLDVIQFNYAEQAILPQYHGRVDCAFTLALNHFNGVESIQLNQRDMRIYNPLASDFNKRYYARYCDALVEQFVDAVVEQPVKPQQQRSGEGVARWLKGSRPVVLSSYEALLQYAYACYDHSIDFDEQLATGKVKLLPRTIEPADIVADIPLFSTGQSPICYYHALDHGQLLREVGDIFFDRQFFSALYKKIRRQKRLDVIELLMSSQHILLDRLAIAFFAEAGFVTCHSGQVAITTGTHQKYNFSGSQIQRQFELFKRGLYRIATENQALMP